MDIFERNKFNIDKRISLGLSLLKQNYELKEIEVNKFKHLHIQNMDYTVEQYEIKGVGNLLIMYCRNSSPLQMDTFVITPYYKNLPLFSTDYIYTKEKRTFLNEIYSLIDEEDEVYNKYIKKFKQVRDYYNYFSDMPMKECWYDNMRPVYVAKNTEVKDDEEIINLFVKNLKIFINMEKESKVLNEKRYKIKQKKIQDYTDKLVDSGGVSTDVFKAILGADKTKEFFNRVFFAPELYKN